MLKQGKSVEKLFVILLISSLFGCAALEQSKQQEEVRVVTPTVTHKSYAQLDKDEPNCPTSLDRMWSAIDELETFLRSPIPLDYQGYQIDAQKSINNLNDKIEKATWCLGMKADYWKGEYRIFEKEVNAIQGK